MYNFFIFTVSLQQLKSFFKMEEKTSFFKKKKEICDLVHFFIFSVSFLKKEQKRGERTRKVKRRLGMGKDTGNHKQEFFF